MASFDFYKQMSKHQQLREVGQKPQLASSPCDLRSWHNFQADASRNVQEADNSADTILRIIAKNSCHDTPASRTSINKLKRISLRDLRILVVAKGSYLILRTLEPAYKDGSIITVVEDHEGNAVLFYVSNITSDQNPDFNDVLPVGTVFILKEPCIQYTILGDCMVRCDCPSDMIVLHEGHEMFPLAENIIWKNEIDPKMACDPISKPPVPKTSFEWKERGNALFKKGKLEYASRCYLIALKGLKGLDDDESLKQILRMNLSAVYLKHGFFEKALEFAKSVLDDDPENGKALFRAGRSSYQLGEYENANRYFEKCCRVCPDDVVTAKELKKTKDRLLEQKTGVFDICKFFLSGINKDQQMMDCSDYMGPIKIVKIPGKGRGIVAVKDVEPGTLLAVSKAVVFTRINIKKPLQGISMDETYDIGVIESYQQLVAPLAQLIYKNPNTFVPIIYDLFNLHHPGEYSPSELFCDPATKKEPIIDANIIEGIIKTNAFASNVKLRKFLKETKELSDLNNFGAGLYVLPSYFNHSCIPNAVFHIFNNVVFIKNIQFIKAGEEVYVPYTSWQDTFAHRQNTFQTFKFQCKCQLCQQVKKLPKIIISKQETILERCDAFGDVINSLLTSDNADAFPDLIREIKALISEMDDTYKIYEPLPLKIAMAPMYFLLCKVYHLHGCYDPSNLDEEIKCLFNVLKLFGFDHQVMLKSLETGQRLITPESFLDQYVLKSVAILAFLYACLGQNATKTKWIQILIILESIYLGGGIDAIKLEYKCLKDYL